MSSVRRWHLQPVATVAGALRSQIRRLSITWGLTDDDTERLLLVVNELVCNAIDHARSPFRLTMRLGVSTVRVLVTDQSSTPPALQPHDTRAVRGRGLQTVAALGRWGWSAHRTGKTVWATIDLAQGDQNSST